MSKKRDGVFKQDGSPYWYISYVLPTGKRIKQSTKVPHQDKGSFNEATAIRNKILTDIRQGKHFQASRDITLDEVRLLWLDEKKDRKLDLPKDNQKLKWFCDLLGKNTLCSLLDYETHKTLIDDALRAKRIAKVKPLTTATKNKYIICFRSALKLAVKRGYAVAPVFINCLELFKVENTRQREMSLDEYERWHKAFDASVRNHKKKPTLQTKLCVIIAYHCPLRMSAILSLRRSLINANGFADVPARNMPIGVAKPRPQYTLLPKEACDIIKKHSFNRDNPDMVFDTTVNAVSKSFAHYCRQANIKGLRFHDLKRTALSRLSNKTDANIAHLKAMSGNKTYSSLDRYVQPTRERIENIYNQQTPLMDIDD